MAIIKCKMCGGDLDLQPDVTVAECEYCGSVQTVPNQDNEKKLTLFARANRLRVACEFDKAAGVYEALVGEFPEEAEAYWGLVLCKFGIEYVDDPKTGKKIPTCHRSSFESVMDDPNLEQAMENTDAVARKVMREEAKQIETIRQRIIEVSSKEEPYDVFICYKETDEHGDRTVDSEMAQNIYEALTERDYRVFFARISLMEDALGKEYEPFIFAALHSAPIMLAIGTDYEHYNAVWVKNEWSRFLMMKEAGMNKTLIPCFKDIDAYDLPKEFRSLQAVNLGKVGAMQDLLSGIEKILPKKKAQPAVVEVQRGASPNVESLLKRGNMFLEDKDWQSADKYFDDVLDIDPECAEAYLGKAMTQHKCMKPEGLVLARLAITADAKHQMRVARERDREREYEIVRRHSLYKYVRMDDIRKHFELNANYTSDVASRKAQYEAEQTWFTQDKYMSRAMRYASGAFKQKLLDIQKKIYDSMEQRIAEAEKSDAAAVKRICDQYEENLKHGDAEGKKLREAAEQQRELDYQNYGVQAEKAIEENDRDQLVKAQRLFEELKDYKESAMMVTILQEKIDAIDAAEEAERQRIAAEEEAERKRIAEEKRYAAEVKAAYEKELPLVKERPETEKRLTEVKNKINELSGKLEHHGGLIFCLIFFVLGVVEFIIGLDGEEFLLTIGAICGVLFGIAVIVILKNRANMRKERRTLTGERNVLEQKLEAMRNCMSLQEFTRVYALRQTEEGRAQLAEEERQRQLKAQREAEAARIAKRKRTTKKIISTVITLLIIAAVIVGFWYLTEHVVPSDRIKKAEAAIAAGDYQLAYDELHENGDYKNTLALREDIAAHGEYRMTAVFLNAAKYSSDDYYYFYEYDAGGLPVRLTVCDSDDVKRDENGGFIREDYSYDNLLSYTFYESGNLQTCSVYSADTGNRIRVLTFHDDPAARVTVGSTHSEAPESFAHITLRLINFYGVKTDTSYNGSGEVTDSRSYSVEGVLNGDISTVDENGLVTYYTEAAYGGSKGHTLTYNEDGTVATEAIDDDLTDGGARDYDDEEWKYKYKYSSDGRLEYRNGTRGAASTPAWQMDYTYSGENGTLSSVTFLERDGDELKTTMTHSCYWTWTDLAAEEQKAAEAQAALEDAVAEAEKLMAQGKYEEAIAIYEILYTYSNSAERINEAKYSMAAELMEQEAYQLAYMAFKDLGDYSDAAKQMKAAWNKVLAPKPEIIDVGENHVVALTAEGTAVSSGDNSYGECNVYGWTDLVSVSAGDFHTAGLKADGTVVATGRNSEGQCNVSEWTDVVTLRADCYGTIGITADGKLLVAGALPSAEAWEEVPNWSNIVDVSMDITHIVGLKTDGTVIASGSAPRAEYVQDPQEGGEIVDIDTAHELTAVKRADGTVEVFGYFWNASDAEDWVGVEDIGLLNEGCIAVDENGVLLVEGDDDDVLFDARGRENVMAIAANRYLYAIVFADGSVEVFTHKNNQINTADWIILPAEAAETAE